jgi:hypothetical protein
MPVVHIALPSTVSVLSAPQHPHPPRLHEERLRAQGVLPSSSTAQGLDRYRQESAPVPQYIRAVGAPLPKAAGTGVHSAVQREIENLLAGECVLLWGEGRVQGLCGG